MTEQEYLVWLAEGKVLLQKCRDFPASELMSYAERNHPEDKYTTMLLWAVHLEASQ